MGAPDPHRSKPARIFSQTQSICIVRYARILAEWTVILVVAWFYASATLLNLNPTSLQGNGEQNQSATFSILAEIGLNRYGEIPLWNPYALTGIPYSEDPLGHFWHPISTIPVMIWGGINGMKVSVFIAFLLAGFGQWVFAHVLGARSFSRLWAALLFMLSGGLAFYWSYGWYELLLGAVWFPWCFATVWWALRHRNWTSIVLAALCITMVLTTGGGYYPFYLMGCLGVLTITHLLWSAKSKVLGRFLRAVAIVLISAGMSAVVILPVVHGLPLFNRWTGDDREQSFSQPIPYALVNFIVSDRNWEGAEILGVPSGWKWFYLSAIAVGAALCLAPLGLVLERRRRIPLITVGILTLAILAWVANRFSPVGYIYDLFPFLYTLRFPNRLLVIAASPLLVLGSLGWQTVYRHWKWELRFPPKWALASQVGEGVAAFLSLSWLPRFILVSILVASVIDVFNVNRAFAFGNGSIDLALKNALTWLKKYDNGLYYINLGGNSVYWTGLSVSYELEMPVINFDFGRRLMSMNIQLDPGSPFIATPKYIVSLPDAASLPENAKKIATSNGYDIWYLPDTLPMAFSAPPAQMEKGNKLLKEMVSPVDVRYDGPNRVVATGQPAHSGDQLVVLVSNYPGWELLVDGKSAPLMPVNEYLGAAMLPGIHTYTFTFRPFSFFLGLTISIATLLLAVGLVLKVLLLQPKHKLARIGRKIAFTLTMSSFID
jgi:hypothetical protein